MNDNHFRSAKLRRIHGQLADIAGQLCKSRFPQMHFGWRPAVNAYRCPDGICVCVDLAGVDPSLIQLEVNPRRVRIHGQRLPPEPLAEHPAVRVLAMEIDYGPFEREIILETEVEPKLVKTEQKNGLLWIHLPLRPHC